MEKLLTPNEVADILGVTSHTLAVWRCCRRYNRPWIKVGRKVRYRASDVEAFIESRRDAFQGQAVAQNAWTKRP
jgi:predicted DNA-binding transcriptional regulator AlpA